MPKIIILRSTGNQTIADILLIFYEEQFVSFIVTFEMIMSDDIELSTLLFINVYFILCIFIKVDQAKSSNSPRKSIISECGSETASAYKHLSFASVVREMGLKIIAQSVNDESLLPRLSKFMELHGNNEYKRRMDIASKLGEYN